MPDITEDELCYEGREIGEKNNITYKKSRTDVRDLIQKAFTLLLRVRFFMDLSIKLSDELWGIRNKLIDFW